MEYSYESISAWFDSYFEAVRRNQADIQTVPNLKKYFWDDLELTMYTSPSSPPPLTMTRDALLLSFIHPDLIEEIVPRSYAIDLKQLIVAVLFEIHFVDKLSGRDWPSLQASAHYHLMPDATHGLKIKRIHYWTEALPKDLLEIWAKRREQALSKLAIKTINAGK
jgi:hypothetical protein